ncbi:MAG: type II secretion system F family protein [Moritella sp.]|uniref:type II secretion system F family protein n=1 Tax=Moritella sp. TaxID=78556 RepID=UPI0025ECF8AA|nr:type II secretion system F family protein [Moritella sp.]NQZ92102.1 type II secretion system F family protein [Moritella sp.]
MYFVALMIGGLLLLFLFLPKKKQQHNYLDMSNHTVFADTVYEDQQAVNIATLSDQTWSQKLSKLWLNCQRQLGPFALAKVILFAFSLAIVAMNINSSFIRASLPIVIASFEISGFIFGYFWLQRREKKQFEDAFPEALNMLTSAVSSGESIMHAIIFVGSALDGEVGKEFKLMGDRLRLGDSPDSVFKKSCNRFPYPAFQFFVITLQANMRHGGQLKEIMTRLNRLMFDARAIEKKKFALTSEARASAKIVGAIPFVFLFLLQYLSPENFEFVMFHPSGRPILYYVLISEAIGISIIWALMKGVK